MWLRQDWEHLGKIWAGREIFENLFQLNHFCGPQHPRGNFPGFDREFGIRTVPEFKILLAAAVVVVGLLPHLTE
jgi:hypothetical protein